MLTGTRRISLLLHKKGAQFLSTFKIATLTIVGKRIQNMKVKNLEVILLVDVFSNKMETS